MRSVFKHEDILIVSVPNLGALHNCFFLLLGIQSTTIAIPGLHVQGVAIGTESAMN
jgi:hypothetical protein